MRRLEQLLRALRMLGLHHSPAAEYRNRVEVHEMVVECHSDGERSTCEVAAGVVELLEPHRFKTPYRRGRQLVHAERTS